MLSPRVLLASNARNSHRKEVIRMEYQRPELTIVTPAISAIQDAAGKAGVNPVDSTGFKDHIGAYEDWE